MDFGGGVTRKSEDAAGWIEKKNKTELKKIGPINRDFPKNKILFFFGVSIWTISFFRGSKCEKAKSAFDSVEVIAQFERAPGANYS